MTFARYETLGSTEADLLFGARVNALLVKIVPVHVISLAFVVLIQLRASGAHLIGVVRRTQLRTIVSALLFQRIPVLLHWMDIIAKLANTVHIGVCARGDALALCRVEEVRLVCLALACR